VSRRKAISLIEMILAVAILGLVAALTLPRFSTAAEAPNEGALLHERLKLLRVAIERYHEDHGVYPGRDLNNPAANCSAATFVAQLAQFTNEQGGTATARDAAHRLGPYLRDRIPACPVPPSAGLTGVQIVGAGSTLNYVPESRSAGWLYNCETGQIEPNSDAADAGGRAYISY
jgi:type II secretory pathway pseudopilin PulG